MDNDPHPHQLTVGRLKELLEDVLDETLVGLAVPPAFRVEPHLTIFYNLSASYAGGPVFKLVPVEAPPDERSVTYDESQELLRYRV